MAPPLSPAALLDGMAAALPTHAKDDTTSDLSSSLDAVALFVHAAMTSVGFRLIGFSEDSKPEEQAECQSLAPRLPSTWNRSLSSHCFVYAHEQSSMRYVIRVDRMGSKIEIRGLGMGDERIARFEITTRDYVSAAALPIRIPISEDTGEEDRSDLPEKLKKVFISDERIANLASLIKINIIQRLVPSLQKEGYEESPDLRAARQDADEAGRRAGGSRQPPGPPGPQQPPLHPLMPEPAQPYPYPDDLEPPPARRPIPTGDFPPPGFEDEYEINRHPRGGGGGMPGLVGGPNQGGGGRSDYGRSDLYPAGLGPDDPMRGSFAPPLGGLPRPGGRGGPGGFGTGGMHPTFDDPLFQGLRGGGNGEGEGGYDDQAPPGARWDPVGPGGMPRFGGDRPGRGGGRGFGGGGFDGFGGDII